MEFDELTQFPLNDAPGKRVILINEPVIADIIIELIKNIMEGQDVAINVKHRKGILLYHVLLLFYLLIKIFGNIVLLNRKKY